MKPILASATDSSLAEAIEDSFLYAWSVFGKLPQAQLHEDQHLTWLDTGLPEELLNGVLRSKLFSVGVDTTIEDLKSHFADRGLPLSWYVGPSARPLDLGSLLEVHGFALAEESVGMAIDLQQMNLDAIAEVPGLVVRRVTDMPTLQAWVDVFRIGFSASDALSKSMLTIASDYVLSPDSQTFHYLGMLGPTPVASATLILNSGVAGVYDVATIPQARNEGVGTALTSKVLLDGRAKGYRFGVLQSSEMAHRLYRRIGFREYCWIKRYTFPPE